MECIDAHAHLRPEADAADLLVALMDRLGIEKAVIVAGGVVEPATLARHIALGGGLDIDVDNARLLRESRRFPGRLLPFYFANPHRGAAPYLADGHAYAGLKLAPVVHGVPFTDPRHRELVAAAARFGHSVYLHALQRDGFAVADVVDLARACPDVEIMLGHGGVSQADFMAIEQIADVPNLVFETSGTFTAVAAAAIRRLGAARVVFGTEHPLQHPRVELEKAACLDLTPDERRQYMRGTITRMLGRHA